MPTGVAVPAALPGIRLSSLNAMSPTTLLCRTNIALDSSDPCSADLCQFFIAPPRRNPGCRCPHHRCNMLSLPVFTPQLFMESRNSLMDCCRPYAVATGIHRPNQGEKHCIDMHRRPEVPPPPLVLPHPRDDGPPPPPWGTVVPPYTHTVGHRNCGRRRNNTAQKTLVCRACHSDK